AYQESIDEARRETSRLLAGRPPVALQDLQKAREEAALLALLAMLEDRYTNFLAGAMREAATAEAEEIQVAIVSGRIQEAENLLESFANNYSDGKLEVLAGQAVREAMRAGRSEGFESDPRTENLTWRRSSVLEPKSTCLPCWNADGTEIDGPDYDVSEICEGG